jgi:hypothetical protein
MKPHEQPIIASVAPRKPIELIVRRGAVRRFHTLKEKTADLPVDVLWDRRESDRRAAACKDSAERRSGDRRQPPPFTWEVSDFVVAAKPKTRKKNSKSRN